jgi:type I restriction enzyme, S subunit
MISNETKYNLDWNIKKLEDMGEFARGKSKHRPRDDKSLFGGKYPFVQTGDVKSAILRLREYSATYNEKGLLQSMLWKKGTLCITIAANIAETAILDIDACFPDSVVGFSAIEDDLDSYFMHYLFCYIRRMIQRSVSGSVQDNINLAYLKKLTFRIPDLGERKNLTNTLKVIDDKIELNNCINKTLEEMVQAIFKNWFVDFEPFIDGEFEDSDLGMIPKGWRVGVLEDYITSIDNRGKTPPLSTQMTPYPIIDVKALSGDSRIINYNNCTKYVEEETYNNWFRSGHPKLQDILISTVGSLAEMKIFYGDKGCVAQNVVAFRSKSLSFLYLYQYLQNIKKDLISYNIGSVQPSIKVTHIIKHKILEPKDEVLQLFEKTVSGISKLIFNNFQQNQTLITIRDSLLSKLMNGEIRVPAKEVQ